MNPMSAFKVLIVEDDEDDYFLLNDYIKNLKSWQIETVWIYRFEDALSAICDGEYKLCFVDYRLGAKNGIDFIKALVNKNCSTPVILLTGKGNYDIDIEATKAGAYDYLVKGDLNEEKLERSIRYALERAATIEKLKESEKKYRAIFEKSREIIFIADTDTTLLDVNAAVTDILETEVKDCLGRQLSSFFVLPARATTFLQQLANKGEIENFEADLSAIEGVNKTCLISAFLETASDNRKYMQGLIHDITNIKKAELVALQTEKLAASGRLIRTLAHEVRNPLNNINLSLENLQAGGIGENEQLYMDIIQRNATRIGNLITELLQSARPADMKFEFARLSEVLGQVSEAVKDRITLKKIQLNINIHTEKTIKADIDKLAMALLNIVVNAVEAVEEETGVIEIVAHEWNSRLVLRIRDNGCGITEDNMSRLFEPYFTSKRNGMGLGLATTLNIIKSHNATIEVVSELGNGTEFIISFDQHE